MIANYIYVTTSETDLQSVKSHSCENHTIVSVHNTTYFHGLHLMCSFVVDVAVAVICLFLVFGVCVCFVLASLWRLVFFSFLFVLYMWVCVCFTIYWSCSFIASWMIEMKIQTAAKHLHYGAGETTRISFVAWIEWRKKRKKRNRTKKLRTTSIQDECIQKTNVYIVNTHSTSTSQC